MALILAVNPGNRHSPTLSRLARELRGCELMGAESCQVAIKAIKKRVPDVLLLPAIPAPGEADLKAHLRSIPGGILTLKLPPVESADPVDLARQIREMLAGVPAVAPPAPAPRDARPRPVDTAPAGPSRQVLAAAAATVTWIRARQAQWSERPEPVEPEEPHEPGGPGEPDESDELREHDPIARPENSPESSGRNAAAFLPRAAALAAVVGIAVAALMYWPQILGVKEASQPAAAKPEPVRSQSPATSAADAKPGPTGPAEAASGWVTVVSPFDVSISEGAQRLELDGQKRVALGAGKHRLRFQNPERGYDATRTVQVGPGETTTVTLTPEATIGVTSNEPAEVSIDGTRVGQTPYEGKVGLGPHTVTVRTAGAERQVTVEATSKPVRLEVDFSKP